MVFTTFFVPENELDLLVVVDLLVWWCVADATYFLTVS